MRWRPPHEHDVRTVTKFLWFPMTLLKVGTDQYETRWLERVTIRQRYKHCWTEEYWESEYFMDEMVRQ